MKREGNLSGSMTVFLSMILVLTLAVAGVCAEYGRSQALAYTVQAGTDAAAESIFAAYHAPLAEEYQIYGRLIPGKDRNRLEEETRRYVGAWGKAEGAAGSLTGFRPRTVSWSGMAMMTDENGALFRELAAEAMKASEDTVLTDLLLEELGFEEGEEVRRILEEGSRKDSMKAGDILKNWEEMADAVEEEKKLLEETGDAPTEPGEGEETPEAPQEEKKRRKGEKYLQLIENIREMLGKGILGMTVPKGKTVSGSRIPAGSLPSRLSAAEKSRNIRGKTPRSGSSLLFREYLMRHMRSFRTETTDLPAYELEYLIGGKDRDEANLRSVVYRLLWMRTALNRHSLSGFGEKQVLIRKAAALAVGWTGNAGLCELVSELLSAAWSLAEGMSDVRILLDGGYVPLLKEEADWQLSLEKAAGGWKKSNRMNGCDRERGNSYEDYLRICLYYQPADRLSYRAMDVIQWNIRRLDGSFRMDACAVTGTLSVTAAYRPLFSPLYGFMVMGEKRPGEIKKKSSFSYLEK